MEKYQEGNIRILWAVREGSELKWGHVGLGKVFLRKWHLNWELKDEQELGEEV